MIKKVLNCYYAHKSNWRELASIMKPDDARDFINVCLIADECYNYEIIKFDSKRKAFSFIESKDWFTANEPIVGDSHIYTIETGLWKDIKGRSNNPQIYHNKWMFMSDDYDTEWINKAKERSKLWNSIPDIQQHKRKIGNQNYWFQLLDQYGIEH